MVSRSLRSTSWNKIKRHTPGGRTTVIYRRKKPAKHRCPCGRVLPGVPNDRPIKIKKLSKSKKRPNRPYGGVLCSKCTREKILLKSFKKG